MFVISEEWRRQFPEAAVGFLVMSGVANPEHSAPLDQRKQDLEENLRARFGRQEPSALETLPTMAPYIAYYRRFKKTYHVLQQRQSVIYKGKSIPSVAALVEAMFMAELQYGLLTAGHDVDFVDLPVTVGASQGTEIYLLMRGEQQQLKAGDMFMTDKIGIISSIIYGPDERTRIRPETTRVMFTVYAPGGIGEGLVYEHLRTLQDYVRLVSPGAIVERLEIFTS
jgi:DNA/RNA-binding domain of Phe-tRNA-synthetase-like protein